jgi:hypothetical protein
MFFKLGVFISVVFSFLFLLPNQTFANVIGTHLGEGDITAQVTIMDFIGTKLSNPEGYPVTIQVYVGNTTRAELDTLAAAAQRNGFFPIVRIDRTCEAASPGLAQTFVNEVEAAFGVFGGEMAIAWGNEVNNEEIECSSGSTYLSGLNNIRGQVAPSALDYYNTVYPAAGFLGQYDIYSGAPYFTANAYGCIGDTAETCNIAETTTHQIGYQDQASRGAFYITEFGLSPGDGQLNNGAPDTDLRNVVDFIETRAADTGAQKVTALMRNVCGGGSRWLILISQESSASGQSEVYTATGAKIDIDTCSGIDAAGDFYLYPITGFYAYDDPGTMQSVIIEELTKQGYQAQCLMPDNDIEMSIPANSNAPTRVTERISASEILEASSQIGIDFRSSRIPGWRLDGDHELPVINSIETLFGFKNTTEDDPTVNLTTFDYAPIYRSLTLEQQCFHQTKILDTIRNMCDKLANPDTCSLNKPIDKTTYDIFGLQRQTNNEINSFLSEAGGDRDRARVLACDSIIENNAHTSQFRRALANTPLYISNAYRLGFLVLSATLEGPLNEVSDSQPFRFLRPTEEFGPNAEPIHEVRVLAFKLPDIGTNKDLESDIYYEDPLQLLSNTSLTKDEQDARDINYKLLTTTQNQYSIPGSVPVQCFYPQSEYCNLPGVQALVRFINMYLRPQELIKPPLLSPTLFNPDGIINEQALNEAVTDLNFSECSLSDEDIPYQAVSRIFSSGEIFETTDLEFVEGNLYESMKDVGVSQTSPDEDGGWPFSFMSFAKIRRDDAPVPAFTDTVRDVKGYLILPQGYQIGHIEETMFNKFHTKEQVDQFHEALKENPRDPANPDNPFSKLVRYFGIEGVLDRFDSTPENNVQVYDTEDPPGCVLPGTQQPIPVDDESEVITLPTCKLYDFFLKIEKDQFDLPRVHGGLFGEVFLATQKTLYTFQSDGWNYIDSCETIEDFILGTCSGWEDREQRIPPREVGPEITAVAQCTPGSPRITSGDQAQHVDAEDSPPGQVCRTFSSSSPNHFISGWRNPNELPRDRISEYCENIYSYAACTYKNALIQNPVNPDTGEWLDPSSTDGITACEFVAQKAYDAGVSPIFALAMWGEESGFSQYRDAFAMGVVSQPRLDLEAQTRVFLNTVTNETYNSNTNAHPTNTSNTNTNNINSYLNFLEQYAAEERGSNLFCRNPNFPARMKDYHNHLMSRL